MINIKRNHLTVIISVLLILEKMRVREILVDLLFVMMVVRLLLQVLSAGVMDVH